MNICIVGAGASGMIAGILLARKGNKVTIIEKNHECGEKLSLTGNGRCNFTNRTVNSASYFNNELADVIIKKYNTKECIDFYNSIGVEIYIKDDFIYPKSEQADSVRTALLNELKILKVDILLETEITDFISDGKKYILHGKDLKKGYLTNFDAEAVVLAIGSFAMSRIAYDENSLLYNNLMKRIKINNFLPAIAPVYCETKNFFKLAKGVRVKCKVSLILDDLKFIESGEVQINSDGFSGFPIMQLSRYVSILKDKKLKLVFEFISENKFIERFNEFKNKNPKFKIYDLAYGIINTKLWEAILQMSRVKKDCELQNISDKDLYILTKVVSNASFNIIRLSEMDKAQCCTGGIDLSEVNFDNLQLRKLCNVYAIGEILDVDGRCGGYNLHFAYASASYLSEKGEFN